MYRQVLGSTASNRVLIDTNVYLWLEQGKFEYLFRSATAVLGREDASVLLSLASVWEMAIKNGNGKLQLREPVESLMQHGEAEGLFKLLPIIVMHVATAGRLLHHHRDPFDRLLAAQSLIEQIPIISPDAIFDSYGVNRIWA